MSIERLRALEKEFDRKRDEANSSAERIHAGGDKEGAAEFDAVADAYHNAGNRIRALIAELGQEVETRVPRQFRRKTDGLAMCPASCGCLWVNNGDGSVSLFGENSKSCDECETLPWAQLMPVRIGFTLGQEVGAVESFRGSLNSWIMAYPEQCFSEPQPEELFWLRDAKPGLLDRISASMGRHVAKCLINDFDAAFSNFTTSLAHTSEARDAVRLDVRYGSDEWKRKPLDARLIIHATDCASVIREDSDAVLCKHQIAAMHDDMREAIERLRDSCGIDAAMRQEAE